MISTITLNTHDRLTLGGVTSPAPATTREWADLEQHTGPLSQEHRTEIKAACESGPDPGAFFDDLVSLARGCADRRCGKPDPNGRACPLVVDHAHPNDHSGEPGPHAVARAHIVLPRCGAPVPRDAPVIMFGRTCDRAKGHDGQPGHDHGVSAVGLLPAFSWPTCSAICPADLPDAGKRCHESARHRGNHYARQSTWVPDAPVCDECGCINKCAAVCRRSRRASEAPLVALVNAVPEGLDANGWRAAVLAEAEGCSRDGTAAACRSEGFADAIRVAAETGRRSPRWGIGCRAYLRALAPHKAPPPERTRRDPYPLVCDAWEV